MCVRAYACVCGGGGGGVREGGCMRTCMCVCMYVHARVCFSTTVNTQMEMITLKQSKVQGRENQARIPNLCL